MQQTHLKYKERVNLGSYYTPPKLVDLVWQMIEPILTENSVILDSSCGYGSFFVNKKIRQIGGDVDEVAIKKAQEINPNVEFMGQNGLFEVDRKNYKISKKENLLVIGNPPYNDLTSIIRSGVKENSFEIDEDLRTRDLGMSFLLSYDKLQADYICVLHPLSYLIKKANFNSLQNFNKNYKLIDGFIISSGEFSETSKTTQFPILVALYKRGESMDYGYIWNYQFQVFDENKIFNPIFCLNQFDYLDNYISKYPSKWSEPASNSILFWTMRDINALKRSRTFVEKFGANTIIVDKKKLIYYIYADVCKDFLNHFPYYFGNCNIPIDQIVFLKFQKYFILYSTYKNPFLANEFKISKPITAQNLPLLKEKINQYFQTLLTNHYVH